MDLPASVPVHHRRIRRGRGHGQAVPRSKTEGKGEGIATRRLPHEPVPPGPDGQLADPDQDGRNGKATLLLPRRSRQEDPHAARDGTASQLAHSERDRYQGSEHPNKGKRETSMRRPVNSGTANFWSDADWIPCSDGKSRPTQPGVHPLAHGTPNRVGRLCAYGNALCAPQAQAFIKVVISILDNS